MINSPRAPHFLLWIIGNSIHLPVRTKGRLSTHGLIYIHWQNSRFWKIVLKVFHCFLGRFHHLSFYGKLAHNYSLVSSINVYSCYCICKVRQVTDLQVCSLTIAADRKDSLITNEHTAADCGVTGTEFFCCCSSNKIFLIVNMACCDRRLIWTLVFLI